MDTATGKLVATKEESGDVSESETGRERRCDRETALLIKQLRGNPMHSVNQTAKEVQKLKRQNGHTIWT